MGTFYTLVDYNEVETNLAIAINLHDDHDGDEDYNIDCDLNDLYSFERFS